MDAECARADLEHLRKDLWIGLARKNQEKSGSRAIAGFLRVVSVACVLVLLIATPLPSLEGPRVVPPESTATLEWITPDEKTLLSNLRRHLSDSNSFAAAKNVEKVQVEKEKPDGRKPEETRAEKRAPNGVPYDQIASLVRTGEKALKNERPAITIER
jgi:hypothetical protein